MAKLSDSDLNDKQLRFCQEYVIDQNETKAAIRAGYSKKTAAQHACRLLKNVKIRKKVQELQGEIAERLEITADRIAQEYAAIGFSDFSKFVDSGNALKDISKLPNQQTRVVESVKRTVSETMYGTTTTVQVKLHSKIAALDALSKHIGFFSEDNRQKTPIIPPSIVLHGPEPKD